jgi:hypothetical protein
VVAAVSLETAPLLHQQHRPVHHRQTRSGCPRTPSAHTEWRLPHNGLSRAICGAGRLKQGEEVAGEVASLGAPFLAQETAIESKGDSLSSGENAHVSRLRTQLSPALHLLLP